MSAPHLEGAGLPPPPGAPGGNALSVVTRRITQWENGVPVVRDVPMLTKSQIVDTIAAVVSLPYYDPQDDLAVEMGLKPSRFWGMTNAEAMITRLVESAAKSGDKDEVEKILDRLLGKPKQTSETIKTTLTYEDRLKEIAARRALAATPAKDGASPPVVEAEIIPPRPAFDQDIFS